jgi:mannose-6-phosphate isomerase-like protein (cupin superfamily)
MDIRRLLQSPSSFLIQDYEPGLCIDLPHLPPKTTALDRPRASEQWRGLGLEEALRRGQELLQQCGLSSREDDLVRGLREFTHAPQVQDALPLACRLLGLEPTGSASEDLFALLSRTVLCEPSPAHHRIYCHIPGATTRLEQGATHFGYVAHGTGQLVIDDRTYPLYPHTYFCVPGAARVEGACELQLITRFGYQGVFTLGGPVEPWGRLRYIDGCTDSLLVPPVRLGDPCYNALYFPPRTRQTSHTHPSPRAGVVIHGSGVCKTPTGDHALTPGKLFLLPPDTWHAFWTSDEAVEGRSALTVLAFHPDSDHGPTDEDHPMLNRTYFEFLHRLRSEARTSGLTSR